MPRGGGHGGGGHGGHHAAHESAAQHHHGYNHSQRMQYHHAGHSRAAPAPIPTAIGGIRATGTESGCGCPGCHRGSYTIDRTMPPQFNGLYTPAEYASLAQIVETALSESHWPLCPCLFTLCCFPVSICYKHQQQEEKLGVVAARENGRLAKQGLELVWTPMRFPNVLVLKWIENVRPQYEAANPQERAVSQEPTPIEFQGSAALLAQGLVRVLGATPMSQQQQQQPGPVYVQPAPQYGQYPPQQQLYGSQPVYPYPLPQGQMMEMQPLYSQQWQPQQVQPQQQQPVFVNA
jgi:hypothetical protein